MIITSSVLRQYQIIAAISNSMFVAAHANQWDQLVELGDQYHREVEALRNIRELSDEDRIARRDLLNQILANDAHIRELASPELKRLRSLLGTMKRQQSVLQAYCTSAAGKE